MIARRPSSRAIAVLVIATAALSLAAAGDGTLPGDVGLARWLQAHPIPLADQLTGFTNRYVSGAPLAAAGIAIVVGLLAARRPEAARLVALATALRATNQLLKSIIDSPRPSPAAIRVTEQASGLGFPSGHAMGAALLLGALAYLLWPDAEPVGRPPVDAALAAPRNRVALLRRALAAGCLALVLLTGYGRIHTGAHWPSDVLGGYLWGALILLATLRLTRPSAPEYGR